VDKVYSSFVSRLTRVIRRPVFWLILILLALITLPHYHEVLQHPSFLTLLTSKLGLDRHAFERILYLGPIVWAGFLFGWRGAVITSLTALACMLPRAILLSQYPIDALFETGAVFIIGNVLAISFDSLRKERDYRTRLEEAQEQLRAHVEAIKENEKRLASLNQISGTISQSLELNQVLGSAIDNVSSVMQVDGAWAFLLNEDAAELELAAYQGIPEEFARGVDKLKVGEGFSGRVARSGKPLFVDDVSQDSRLTREVVSKYGVQSMLVVPLTSKGKVNGTICIATYSHRFFQKEEIELLTVIGNQIGVAVENARLYQKQQEVAEQLRRMEENLRFYLHQVTRAQEEERKRISRELHDDTVQSLVAAALDRLGLLPALEWLASDVAEFSGIETKVNVVGTEHRLPEEVELVLFRITQEAMRNVWRHSQATKAEITVEFDQNKTRIAVSDNGKGFKLPKPIDTLARDGKLGLAGMQERARLIGGNLAVQSEIGKGSTLTVEIPE